MIRSQINSYIKVSVNPGADMVSSIHRSRDSLRTRTWDQIILTSGLCHLTHKNPITKKVFLAEENIETCVSNFGLKLEGLRDLIISCNGNLIKSKLTVAPITGMDLVKYNGFQSSNIENQQLLLNQSIVRVNTEIARYNRLNEVFTPWTSRIVHQRYRHKYHAKYDRLSNDGCHLTDETLLHWANSLVEAILKNS